jgi:hypothetical protein
MISPGLVVLLVLIGIVVAIPLTGLDYELRRIWKFQRRRLKGQSAPATVSLFSQEKRQVPLTDVRDLIISLQLGTSMESTLTGSLARAAEQFARRGILGERLQRHVQARLSISPEAVLEGLVEDFDCPQLAELLHRIRMAAEGGISYNRVLAVSVNDIEEDISTQVEQRIEKAPMRLTPLMIGGVFLPALLLGLIPLFVTLMRGL